MPYTSSNSSGQYTSDQRNAIARRSAPSLRNYLGSDSAYLAQSSGLQKNLDNYRNQYRTEQDRTRQDFGTAFDRMKMQRDSDLENMQGDFASRGILTSGLYTGAVGDYDTKYQQQFGDLSQDKQRKLADLLRSYQQFRDENTTSLQQAKADAIRRRAMQYGII